MTFLRTILRWFDSSTDASGYSAEADDSIDVVRLVPFILLHVACFGVIWVGWSWTAVAVAVLLYAIRMFAITAFYHRYFSHKTFQAGRLTQFVFAVIGNAAIQRGPLWWAAHHRHHHQHSDDEHDSHSPHQHSFLWSHMLWFMTKKNFQTDTSRVRDFNRFPELRFLDRFDNVVPVMMFAGLFGTGELLAATLPQLGTSGAQLLIWGAISTIVLFHATCTINSLAHQFGSQRFDTDDESRNNWMLALITFGEGWHNNHHHYPNTVRQGFYWWEIDLTYYALRVLEAFRLIHDLRPVPAHITAAGRSSTGQP
jgi:stearoyl-CoA desaturase (delta-9 desaturase)